jgi:uncharacterized protein YecT (DUF1311 family)
MLFFVYLRIRRIALEGKMFSALLLLLLYLVNFSSPHQDPPSAPQAAATQPCSEAKTQTEINECFAKLYEQTDAQLNTTYNKIVASMKSSFVDAQRQNATPQITHDQAAMDKLLAAQRAWLTYRDLHCDSVKFQYEGGSLSPTAWSQCMAETTQQRIASLTTSYDLSN